MTKWITAHTISRPTKKLLSQKEFTAHVLGIFERACNLVTTNGEVIALVMPEIGNGPFNIVVDDNPTLFARIQPDTPATVTDKQLQIGEIRVDLKETIVWEPQPHWELLRTGQVSIVSGLPFLRAAAHRHAPENTLLTLLKVPRPNEGPVLSAARIGTDALQGGWAGDQTQLNAAGKKLAGLGIGLTPACDDFLCGVMLWAWLTHPNPAAFCQPLLHAAAPRTTTLSAAFLRAAAGGECSDPWHKLLAILSAGARIEIAAQNVLAHGATSGADTLAGFLYLPTFTPPRLLQPSPDTPSPQ